MRGHLQKKHLGDAEAQNRPCPVVEMMVRAQPGNPMIEQGLVADHSEHHAVQQSRIRTVQIVLLASAVQQIVRVALAPMPLAENFDGQQAQ